MTPRLIDPSSQNLPLPDRMADLKDRINALRRLYAELRQQAIDHPEEHVGQQWQIHIRDGHQFISAKIAEEILPPDLFDQIVQISEPHVTLVKRRE